jgi:hypothetical protein
VIGASRLLKESEMAYGYEVPQIQDKALNDAILSNDIRFDCLPFIELCHRHYADEVDLTFGVGPRRTVTRDTLQGMLMNFLLPIHLVSEIGGVEVTVEVQHITSVTPDQQHSFWSVEFLSKNGARHVMSWKTMRIWIADKVVAEHHYDQSHEGRAIVYSDLELKRFDANYFPDHL